MTEQSNQLRALADEQLDVYFRAEPLEASLYGIPGYDHLLPDPSEDGDSAIRARSADVAAAAAAIDPSTLDDEEAVTRAVVEQQARSRIHLVDAKLVEYTISGLFISPAAELLSTLPMVPLPDHDRAQAYVERLRAVPGYLAAVAERHRIGVAAGRLPVERLVRSAIILIDRYLAESTTDSLLRQQLPSGVGTLAAERERVVTDLVRPAFAAYRDVLAEEIVQHGRPDDRPGACWLPDGAAIYSGLSTVHTTTHRTPEELHRIGLDLIASLTDEYAEIGARVFGSTDQQEIFRSGTPGPPR